MKLLLQLELHARSTIFHVNVWASFSLSQLGLKAPRVLEQSERDVIAGRISPQESLGDHGGHGQHFPSLLLVQVVRPSLHHLPPLVQVRGTVIGRIHWGRARAWASWCSMKSGRSPRTSSRMVLAAALKLRPVISSGAIPIHRIAARIALWLKKQTAQGPT
jgi:hypothetical protein